METPGSLAPLLPGGYGIPGKPFRVGERNSVDTRELTDRQASKTATNRLSNLRRDRTIRAQNDETHQCRYREPVIVGPLPMATENPSAHAASFATLPCSQKKISSNFLPPCAATQNVISGVATERFRKRIRPESCPDFC